MTLLVQCQKFQGVVGIVLFGSQARGDYDEFSDYDLLVLFENKQFDVGNLG